MRRRMRGFTLLEAVLASALAGLVALVTVAALASMARADRAGAARFEAAFELDRTRTIVRRALGTLLLAPRGAAPAGDSTTAPAAQDPPRALLESDASDSLARAYAQAVMGTGMSDTVLGVQRFEVLLSRPPVPTTVPSVAALEGGYRACRGVFELHPYSPGQGEVAGMGEAPAVLWRLWWRPLPTSAEAAGDSPAQTLEPPVLLCSQLTACRWSVYKQGQFQTELNIRRVDELPAYVRLELKTARGLSVDWLFELDWLTGQEETPAATAVSDPAGAGAGGGAAGAGTIGTPRGGGRGGRRGGGERPPGGAAPPFGGPGFETPRPSGGGGR